MKTPSNNTSLVYIDPENCIGCSKCKKICPIDAIIEIEGKKHKILSDKCIKCRLCINICPKNCIKLTTTSSFSLNTVKQLSDFVNDIKNDQTTIQQKKKHINRLIKEIDKDVN